MPPTPTFEVSELESATGHKQQNVSVSKVEVGDEDESAFATNEGFDSNITLV